MMQKEMNEMKIKSYFYIWFQIFVALNFIIHTKLVNWFGMFWTKLTNTLSCSWTSLIHGMVSRITSAEIPTRIVDTSLCTSVKTKGTFIDILKKKENILSKCVLYVQNTSKSRPRRAKDFQNTHNVQDTSKTSITYKRHLSDIFNIQKTSSKRP